MKTFKEFQDKFTKKAEKLLKKKFTKDEEIEQTISLIGEMLQDLARDLYNELPFEQIKTSSVIKENSTVVITVPIFMTHKSIQEDEAMYKQKFGCNVVILDGMQELSGVFNPELFIKEDGPIGPK